MNYETIKRMAREKGISVKDLCALSLSNDPFYTGRKAQVVAARWFADLWERFGYSDGVHLRRVHYQLVSQDPPMTKPNGAPYGNTNKDWNFLLSAGKWARYLRLVLCEAFVDRHNPKAKIFAHWSHWGDIITPLYVVDNYDYDLPRLPSLPKLSALPDSLPELADFSVDGYIPMEQSYHVEVWCEKTTMNDILEPLCIHYGVNLITGKGEMSITAVVDFLRRLRRSERPGRILYVSDYDSAGSGMPISVARKIEFFQREKGYHDLDIRLQPLILTGDQVKAYNLPRTPVRDSDRRKARWEADHGKGIVELDALEALHPGELERIVKDAILDYYDPSLQDRAKKTRRCLTDDLRERRDDITARYRDELDDLDSDYGTLVEDFDETRSKFSEMIANFQPQIEGYSERLEAINERCVDLYGQVEEELEAVDLDLDDYALPEPNLPDESDSFTFRTGTISPN